MIFFLNQEECGVLISSRVYEVRRVTAKVTLAGYANEEDILNPSSVIRILVRDTSTKKEQEDLNISVSD